MLPETIRIESADDLDTTRIAALVSALSEYGFGFVRIGSGLTPSEDLLVSAVHGVAPSLAHRVSISVLDSLGTSDALPIHVECIDHGAGAIEFFALACLVTPALGGETRLFDGRRAVESLLADDPTLAEVTIRYKSLTRPGESATHPLVLFEEGKEGVLRYRELSADDELVNACGYTKVELDKLVLNRVRACMVVAHSWAPGELLFVNNSIMLHDRLPFVGHRRFIRIRFDESEAVPLAPPVGLRSGAEGG